MYGIKGIITNCVVITICVVTNRTHSRNGKTRTTLYMIIHVHVVEMRQTIIKIKLDKILTGIDEENKNRRHVLVFISKQINAVYVTKSNCYSIHVDISDNAIGAVCIVSQ